METEGGGRGRRASGKGGGKCGFGEFGGAARLVGYSLQDGE